MEVTYRKGKPFAAYLHLGDGRPQQSCRTEEIRPGVLADIVQTGELLGIEFLSPGSVTAEDLQGIICRLPGAQLCSVDLMPIMRR
ncbi:MAG TPA: DUF2283 domain-containing protein [Planctomycetota bacterium]|nr:DUF2283 domain-containing protein [Planctomycetota bacterium]